MYTCPSLTLPAIGSLFLEEKNIELYARMSSDDRTATAVEMQASDEVEKSSIEEDQGMEQFPASIHASCRNDRKSMMNVQAGRKKHVIGNGTRGWKCANLYARIYACYRHRYKSWLR